MIKFNLKMLRLLNGDMTARRLQQLSGIRPSTLTEYEHSRAKTISIKHLNTLCTIFNCQPNDIMTFVPDEEENK